MSWWREKKGKKGPQRNVTKQKAPLANQPLKIPKLGENLLPLLIPTPKASSRNDIRREPSQIFINLNLGGCSVSDSALPFVDQTQCCIGHEPHHGPNTVHEELRGNDLTLHCPNGAIRANHAMAKNGSKLFGDIEGLPQVDIVGKVQVLDKLHLVGVQMLPHPCRVRV